MCPKSRRSYLLQFPVKLGRSEGVHLGEVSPQQEHQAAVMDVQRVVMTVHLCGKKRRKWASGSQSSHLGGGSHRYSIVSRYCFNTRMPSIDILLYKLLILQIQIMLAKLTSNSERAKKITQSITFFMCKDLHPYSVVENFFHMLKTLEPNNHAIIYTVSIYMRNVSHYDTILSIS